MKSQLQLESPGIQFAKKLSPSSLAVLLSLLANTSRRGWRRAGIRQGDILEDLGVPRRRHGKGRNEEYYRFLHRSLMEMWRAGVVTDVSLFQEQKINIGGLLVEYPPAIKKKQVGFTYKVAEPAVEWFRENSEIFLAHIEVGGLRRLWGWYNGILGRIYALSLLDCRRSFTSPETNLVINLLGYSAQYARAARIDVTIAFKTLSCLGLIEHSSANISQRRGVVMHRWQLIPTPEPPTREDVSRLESPCEKELARVLESKAASYSFGKTRSWIWKKH